MRVFGPREVGTLKHRVAAAIAHNQTLSGPHYEKRNTVGVQVQLSGKHIVLAVGIAILAGCSPRWPSDRFPDGLEVKRTLFAGGGGGFRETCEAMVVEITDKAASRSFRLKPSKDGVKVEPLAGWMGTPIATGEERAFYKGAFGGCTNGGDSPLGDMPGWLERPGAFYKVINGGEGVAIIVPRSKLAGFYYFG